MYERHCAVAQYRDRPRFNYLPASHIPPPQASAGAVSRAGVESPGRASLKMHPRASMAVELFRDTAAQPLG